MATFDSANSSQTILIVDDRPENLAMLGQLLQSFYRVRAAISDYCVAETAMRNSLRSAS